MLFNYVQLSKEYNKNMSQNYSIYVHIPFCKARCSYCAFSSNTDFGLQQAYFDKLFAEIDGAYKPETHISTVFLGGGTPSAVDDGYLIALFDKLRQHFDFSSDCEITCEVNPESGTRNKLRLLADMGVNRVSFGLQSMNDETLRKIGRLHTARDFLQAVDNAKKVGIDNVNADIILGLPESNESFMQTVENVCELPLTHVSMYALELYPETPLWQRRNECTTDPDRLADLYDMAVERLAKGGFARYETSNFARDGKQCGHNLNYWREGRYYGFGASASGFVCDTRYTDVRDINGYIAADNLREEEQTVSRDEQANEYVMLALRLTEGVCLTTFTERYGSDFWQYFANARQLQSRGFLQQVGDSVTIPDDKVYVANSILAELLNI